MKKKLLVLFFVFAAFTVKAQQKVIQLYNGVAPGSENWNYDEKEFSPGTKEALIYNVSHPTLTVYPADPAIATGTAVIVCPGGGFYILSINSEGIDVANWLNKKGITVFVLKYRLAQSMTDNPGRELGIAMKKSDFADKVKPTIPFSIADGREAIKYVRAHAAEYKISPSRVGIIGFSAGGTVAASSAFNYTPENRPDFVAPIYAYMPPYLQGPVLNDAPPMFLAAATNDELGLASHSVDLYSKWLTAKRPAELHIFEKGGHGFGMRKQDIPTDHWIERFGDWLDLQGLLKSIDPKVTAWLAQLEKRRISADEQQHKDWPFIKKYQVDNSKLPPPAAGENRVVFMGNSIEEFWKMIDSAYFKPSYIDRGISGQTTPQMLLRFREDVINLKPAVVVILAGINDIGENTGPNKLENVFGNIVSMVQLAQAAHIKVVLSSVLPANHLFWRPAVDPTEKVGQLNQMIKDYATQNHIVYLDFYSAMVDDKKGLPLTLSADGVHPNLAGYKVMEPLTDKAIRDALSQK